MFLTTILLALSAVPCVLGADHHYVAANTPEDPAKNSGYTFEGPAGYAWTAQECDTLQPIYRWLNPSTIQHLFTNQPNEKPAGWKQEGGPAFWLKKKQGRDCYYGDSNVAKNSVALYRCYCHVNGDHLLTTSNNCEGAPNYYTEGIVGYICPSEPNFKPQNGDDGHGGVYSQVMIKRYYHS